MGTSATEISPLQPRASDQRLSLRRRLSQPIPIELLPGKEVRLHDLGEGGLSVFGSPRLEVGTTASASFRLPETDSLIDARGVVVWSNESGRLGMRFTRIEPDSTVVLRRWLKNGALAASESSTMNHAPDAELASRISCLSEVADLQSVISNEQFDSDAALNLIVRRMTELTRATGAAIALREGKDVVCRARAGDAPDVGVKLSPTSLSGQSFHSGTIVTLDDSESDPRVNPDLCRQLNFRSLLVLPITSAGEVIGIAEVLSPNPRNFAGSDILVLSFLADLIASVALPRLEPNLFAVPPVLPVPGLDDLRPLPEVALNDGLDLESPALAPPVSQPFVEAKEISDAPIEERFKPEHAEPIGTFIAPEVPEIVQSASWQTAHELILPTEKVPRDTVSRPLAVAVTFIVLLATAALLTGYYFSRSLNLKRNVTAIPVSASVPVASTAPKAAPPTPLPHSQLPADATTPPRLEPKISIATGVRQAAAAAAPVTPSHAVVAPPPMSELQVIHGSSPRPVVNTDNATPEAPVVGAIASRGTAPLPNSIIAAKTATPELQAPAPATGVTEGRLIKRVMPRYPEMARTAGVSGDVVLSAKIATDGSLQNLKVVSGSPLLQQAAIEAARQWRYSPYKLDGKPVETDTRITISFHR